MRLIVSLALANMNCQNVYQRDCIVKYVRALGVYHDQSLASPHIITLASTSVHSDKQIRQPQL